MNNEQATGDLHIKGAGLTHLGLIRERNEDAILLDPAGELWAVADGMGGYGQGDVAAGLVIDQLAQIENVEDPQTSLNDLIQLANTAIYEKAQYMGETMGTTVVAAYIQNDIADLAWVGDSRIYLWRADTLRQISKDHSVVQEMIDDGLLTPEAAGHHPHRNVVTRALGVDDTVEVAFATVPLRAGDRVLLCSDGLTTCVSDAQIAQMFVDHDDLDSIAAQLVQATLDAGAPDNVSLVIVAAYGD